MYTDFMKEHFEALQEAPSSERKNLFLEYCRKAITAYEAGEVTRQDAAYAIAGTMFLPEISSDPELEAITLEAGSLELPDEHVSGDPEERWRTLVSWVDEYEKKFKG